MKCKLKKENIINAVTNIVVLGGITAAIGIPIISYVSSEENKHFKYRGNGNGQYIAEGTLKLENLKQCSFIQLSTNESYICYKNHYNSHGYKYDEYVNLLNNQLVYSNNKNYENSNRKLTNEILISDYLYGYNDVKAEYTPEDVKNLLEQIKEDIKEENKVLVKTKFNVNYVSKVG